MALTTPMCTSVANASPSGDAGQCSFLVSTPKVVEVSGVSLVAVSLKPGPCTLGVTPNFSEVCLSIQGDDSPGQCATKSGPEPALLHYPYRPGATYIVKGQGCADRFAPPDKLCQNFGPSPITL